jgi:negative regulator of sigma E activity
MTSYECVRRARDDTKKMLLWKGRPVLLRGERVSETVYSDGLMMFGLNAHDRKRYGDKLGTTLGRTTACSKRSTHHAARFLVQADMVEPMRRNHGAMD